MPQFKEAFKRLNETSPAASSAVQAEDVKDLPLIEVPAKTKESGTFVVILSGDGGWAGIDRELGDAFVQKGIPVVGLNSLQYFWNPRTPEGFTKDLERVLRYYRAAWRKDHVILVGYSQGADVLPFAIRRFPDDLLGTISLAVLLGPEQRAHFEFHLTHWLGEGSEKESLAILPELQEPRAHYLCLYGEEEKDSLCRSVDPHKVETDKLPGGHHFNGRYDRIVDRILSK